MEGELMAMVRRSDLVDALAAVAVSALSGPLGAIGVSAAGELVKLLQQARGRTSEEQARGRTSEEKELQKQVREAITAWADGERLDQDVVERGLAWAIEYVQAAGCQHELIADADFDPTRAAEAVLTLAKARDGYWGTDPEYGVAERAVHVTYNALCPKLKAEGGVVLAAIQASRHEIRGSIDQLREDLLGVANRHELIEYLKDSIDEWDYSPWTQSRKWSQDRRPSRLERTLEIADEQRTMSTTEALKGVWLLTVLGGPGSGKTWLARRLAREAAETALEQLQDPRVDPTSVELPLVTTVAEWIKRRGTGFEGLVEAALPHESQERIRRLVLRPGARVLAVADSLDEGVSVNSARTLLNSLTSSPTRRLVVTSRPEAWHSATAGLRATQDTRIGTLTELRYPKDVHGYVEAWFPESPPTAQHLIRQLERRRELRATATSPLLLTFYCMLTEQEPDQELPRRRRELYRTIIDLLLAGGWATTEEPVDRVACRAILQQWAWEAVKDAVTPAGLGVWPETITTNRTPPDVSAAMERALDNVAPKQEHPRSSHYDHARVERRFLHRTLWEYLVSEHIATFSATKAAKALLPHIWFDPDWHATLPMAIAAHQKRSKLTDQLWTHHTDHPTPAQEVVNIYLEALMLEVATQTDPEDWNKANRARIHSLRENLAPHHPELIVGSAHWGGLNHAEAICAALSHAIPFRTHRLVRALLDLAPTDTERAKARRAILIALPYADPVQVDRLIDFLSKLAPTETERTKAHQIILTTLLKAVPWGGRLSNQRGVETGTNRNRTSNSPPNHPQNTPQNQPRRDCQPSPCAVSIGPNRHGTSKSPPSHPHSTPLRRPGAGRLPNRHTVETGTNRNRTNNSPPNHPHNTPLRRPGGGRLPNRHTVETGTNRNRTSNSPPNHPHSTPQNRPLGGRSSNRLTVETGTNRNRTSNSPPNHPYRTSNSPPNHPHRTALPPPRHNCRTSPHAVSTGSNRHGTSKSPPSHPHSTPIRRPGGGRLPNRHTVETGTNRNRTNNSPPNHPHNTPQNRPTGGRSSNPCTVETGTSRNRTSNSPPNHHHNTLQNQPTRGQLSNQYAVTTGTNRRGKSKRPPNNPHSTPQNQPMGS